MPDRPITSSDRWCHLPRSPRPSPIRRSHAQLSSGETTKTITIEVTGDGKKEADETSYLDLLGLGSNALFTENRGLGTILNDD